MKRLLFYILMLSASFYAFGSELDDSTKKMCWVHAVSWGFSIDKNFDSHSEKPSLLPFADAPLYSSYEQSDKGKWENSAKQIECAKKYGIDGIMVDIPIIASYSKVMKRYFDAAQNTDVKIALCMDNNGAPSDELVKSLDDFLKQFGKHPNASYINGRHVIFIYNSDSRTPTQWKSIVGQLNALGHNPYFIARAIFEIESSRPQETLNAYAYAYDGFYDFGVSGFFKNDMIARLAMQKKALKQNPDSKKIMVASIAQGYRERRTSFYRPYLGTLTLRDNWSAALAVKPDWICLSTWDDYGETTAFEPTKNNGDSILILNSHYLKIFRNDSDKVLNKPEVLLSYRRSIAVGTDFRIDAAIFAHSQKNAFLKIKILKSDGSILKEFAPKKLDARNDAVGEKIFTLTDLEMSGLSCLRILAAISDTENFENAQWVELHSASRRYGRVDSPATVRALMGKTGVAQSVKLSIEKDGATNYAIVDIDKKYKNATLEILRNGFPLFSKKLSAEDLESPLKIPMPSRFNMRRDIYCARIEYGDACRAYSNTAELSMKKFASAPKKPRRKIATNSGHDENWSIFAQNNGSPKIAEENISECDIFSAVYLLKKREKDFLTPSKSSCNFPAKLGAEAIRTRRNTLDAPKWESEEVNGVDKNVLAFSGNNAVSFQNDSMPEGLFTIEMLIKPQEIKRDMFLFSDWRNFSLGISPEGFVVAELHKQILASNSPIKFDEWIHLAFVCAADKMLLYINGKLVGERTVSPLVKFNGNVPFFGGDGFRNSKGFVGKLSAISIEGAARDEKTFRLLKK